MTERTRTWRIFGSLIIVDVVGRAISEDDFTSSVGIKPDKAWAAGDVRYPSLPMTHQESGLGFNSRLGEDASPPEHIGDLHERLEPYLDSFKRYTEGFTVELSLTVYTSGRMPEFNIAAESVQWLASLNASIDVDIIVHS